LNRSPLAGFEPLGDTGWASFKSVMVSRKYRSVVVTVAQQVLHMAHVGVEVRTEAKSCGKRFLSKSDGNGATMYG